MNFGSMGYLAMKNTETETEFDSIDLHILAILQDDCTLPLAKIGDKVGLSAPSVVERIKKLEENGVIKGYHAIVDARMLGKDVTAFIGVSVSHPQQISAFEDKVAQLNDVLECHHVTGQHTLLIKAKTEDTSSLEALISAIRSMEGAEKTETMVVFSTHTERTQIPLANVDAVDPRRVRSRTNGHKPSTHLKGAKR